MEPESSTATTSFARAPALPRRRVRLFRLLDEIAQAEEDLHGWTHELDGDEPEVLVEVLDLHIQTLSGIRVKARKLTQP